MTAVRELAAGRAGDKGSTLDLTLVAHDDASYAVLCEAITAERAEALLAPVAPSSVARFELPRLRALKYIAPEALDGGLYASLHAGMHWQKAAIWLLLDAEVAP